MSITPQFLDELRERVPISDVVGRFVSWDQKKSNPARGDYWAPCPFHSEKTASFHVDDGKGFYYCFGCHAKGDAVGFLKEKGNLGFVDAVREMASMAGMEMPAQDPRAKEKADANARFIEMHEKAARFYSLQLQSSAGAMAREYIYKKRGLSEAIVQEFRLGFVPNARDLLIAHLREAGFSDGEMVEGGLAIKPDDGGAIYDRFRNRIMFPIQDTRGRTIAFGGRAMDPNARAKYLNSSDSPIFHKGRVVYNFHRARGGVNDQTHIIVAEGYMDVIALAQAGFSTGVAPLGTAITIDQLQMIWRIDPMPILSLDGDEAGLRAADRAASLVLPHIGAGRSLRFAMMPAGLDPDDLINAQGPAGFAKRVEEAVPLVDRLWHQAMGNAPLDTPEARAGFDARLKALAGQIQDQSLRQHYMAEFRDRRNALFSPRSRHQNARQAFSPSSRNTSSHSRVTSIPHQDLRVALVIRSIYAHPSLAKRFVDELSKLSCPNASLEKLRKALVITNGDEKAIAHVVEGNDLGALDMARLVECFHFVRDDGSEIDAAEALSDDLNRHFIFETVRGELAKIQNELTQSGELTEENNALMVNAVLMRDEARKIFSMDMNDDEDIKAYNRQVLDSLSPPK